MIRDRLFDFYQYKYYIVICDIYFIKMYQVILFSAYPFTSLSDQLIQ